MKESEVKRSWGDLVAYDNVTVRQWVKAFKYNVRRNRWALVFWNVQSLLKHPGSVQRVEMYAPEVVGLADREVDT